MPIRFLIAAAVLVFVVALATPAWADHIRGIRIDLASADETTFLVVINIEGYTVGPGTPGDTFPLGYDPYPAIRWGDGAEDPEGAFLLFVHNDGPGGTALYRGAFAHAYPDSSPRILDAFTGCCADPNEIVAGNPVFVGPQRI